ncbi:MAG: hypothetical protein ABJA84_05575 [Polaromonas sp.]
MVTGRHAEVPVGMTERHPDPALHDAQHACLAGLQGERLASLQCAIAGGPAVQRGNLAGKNGTLLCKKESLKVAHDVLQKSPEIRM